MSQQSHYEKLRYTVGVASDDGILLPVNRYKKIPQTSIRKYFGGYDLLFNMDTATRNLLDFLLDNMSIDNIVENNTYKRDLFLKAAKAAGKTYSDETVRKSYQRLKAAGILIFYMRRGLFQINPEIYFKGTERARLVHIRKRLENK